MPGTMIFTAGVTSITINLPIYPYSCELHMPITVVERHPTGYAPGFDADATKASDYRILNTGKWQLPAAQKSALNVFFRDAALGRAETVTLNLGATPTGFFPFGPDKGDSGSFSVRLIAQQQGGMLLSPFKYWQDNISLVLVTAPAFTAGAGTAQGSFQIGTVTGLCYPQNTFAPVSQYNFRTDLSRSGVPHSVDGLTASDAWETQFDQQCNTGNAAALVAYLQVARAGDITIISAANYYVFGMDQGGAGTYTTRFLGSSRSKNEIVIKMTCENVNRWTVPLEFWMVSNDTPS
jgi:hypothetical protein